MWGNPCLDYQCRTSGQWEDAGRKAPARYEVMSCVSIVMRRKDWPPRDMGYMVSYLLSPTTKTLCHIPWYPVWPEAVHWSKQACGPALCILRLPIISAFEGGMRCHALLHSPRHFRRFSNAGQQLQCRVVCGDSVPICSYIFWVNSSAPPSHSLGLSSCLTSKVMVSSSKQDCDKAQTVP